MQKSRILKNAGKKDRMEGRLRYDRHHWSRQELIAEMGKCVIIVVLFSYYFYRSAWALFPMSVIGALLFKRDAKSKAAADRRCLLLQFRDMIQAVAADLRAGYSVENSFLESYPDLCRMHGRDAFISRELRTLKRGLAINITLEDLLRDLGERSYTSQLKEFAAVFSIAKRSGGNMSEVIRASAELIHSRIEAREEILIQTSGRRMERNVMLFMPFLILSYIELSNPGYFDALYHNLQGIGIMSGCLTLYLVAYILSERILEQAGEVM